MISDRKFISRPSNGKKYSKKDFLGVTDGEQWNLEHVAELIGARQPPAEDDPLPAGTMVEFNAPDGTPYKGRVASKSGEDYIVDVTPGESYLVPPGKLAKITPESEQIRDAVRREIAPTMEKVSEHEESNKLIVKISYRDHRPNDGHMMNWAALHYPELRLVDALPQIGRNINLVFELPKQAAEDVRPQGSAPHMPGERGRGLSSEEIEGTGVIGDKIPGGLSEQPLEQGIKIEMEHTNDPEVAKEIAMDHLIEDSKYYDKLKKIEAKTIGFDEVIKEAQLGQPGSADQFNDLNDAARKTLQAFNISNPEHYASPQETEAFGEAENSGVRLWFVLHSKEGEKTSPMYITRQGSIVPSDEGGSKLARGFVQVSVKNGTPDLPMIMIQGPSGPESLQEYGFSVSAAIIKAANSELANKLVIKSKTDPKVAVELEKYVDKNLEDNDKIIELTRAMLANPELTKQLSKLLGERKTHQSIPTDPTTTLISNWPGQQSTQYQHIKPYGDPAGGVVEGPYQKSGNYAAGVLAAQEILDTRGYSAEAQAEYESRLTKLGVDKTTKDLLTKYFKDYGKQMVRDIPRKKHAQKEVDPATVQYWVNYFGSSIFDDGWYGQQMTRTIPKKTYKGDGTTESVDSDDEEGVIGNPDKTFSKEAQWLGKTTKGGPKYVRPPRPTTTPGFFSPGGFLQKKKVDPIKGTIGQAGSAAEQLLSHARINPQVAQHIDKLLHTYQASDASARQKAITDIRLKNPQYQPPAGWQAYDDTLRAALLPRALATISGAIEEALKVVQQSAASSTPAKQTTSTGTETIYGSEGEMISASKIASSDYTAYIKKTNKGYEVKSEKNPSWSGGTYKSKGEAEKRLQQVEMFKHMSFVAYGDIESNHMFGKISECLSICDNTVGILTMVSTLIDDESLNKSAEIQKLAKTLRDMVVEAIQKAETDPSSEFSRDLSGLYHGYLAKHPDLEWKMLEGKGRRHLTPEEISEILYTAAHERTFFKAFQKLLDRYERKDKEKTWQELGEERKKLYKEKRQKERKPWLQWIKEKVSPETPVAKPLEPSKPIEQRPWEKEEPKWEDVPSAQESVPPTPEKAEEPEPTPAKPAPETPKMFGPPTEHVPKVPPGKSQPPVKQSPTSQERKVIEDVAKQFAGQKGPVMEFMQKLMKTIPWPKPETQEQLKQYREKGYPSKIGMTVYEICEYHPDFAYKFLIPHYSSQGDEKSANAIRVYLQQKGVLEGFEAPPGVRPPKKEKERLVKWKGETPEPELSEEPKQKPKFMESKWDTFQVPAFSNATIPEIMNNLWDKKKQLNTFLDYMAVHHYNEITEWGKEALPEKMSDRWVENVDQRRKQYIHTEEQRRPIEEATETGTLSSVLKWTIPENTDIPAFAGDTLEQALKKNKKAVIDFMLKDGDRRTILLSYIKHKFPDQYQYWLDKVSDMESGEKPPEKPKSQVFEPLPSGRYKGKSIPEVLSVIKGTGGLLEDPAKINPQAIDFLAEVYEEAPEHYEMYMKTMDPSVREVYDKKILSRLKEQEEPIEIEESLEEEEELPSEIVEYAGEEEDEEPEEETSAWEKDKALRSAIYGKEMSMRGPHRGSIGENDMRKWSKAGPGPSAYNAPGKNDKEDYDYKERNKQPSKLRTRFNITRTHSTSSTRDGGYVIMELGWDPETFKGMSPQNIQHQVISYIKGLESDKYFHDFGVMGKAKITMFDEEAGVAEIKVRCSETRGIMPVTYCTDDPSVRVPTTGIR